MSSPPSKISSFFREIPKKLRNISTNQKILAGLVSSFLIYALVTRKSPKPKSIEGHVVFITGAASGIGRQVALLLGKAKAKVIIADINLSQAEKVAKEILADNGEALAVHCDVTSVESIKNAAEASRQAFGNVTILINNAGVVSGKRICEIPIEKIEATIKINLLSHFYTIKEFLPSMLERNEGHIVTIASQIGHIGVNRLTDYAASKFGAVGLDEALRNELRSMNSNVKTTCINPTLINTGMFKGVEKNMPALDQAEVGKRIFDAIRFDEKVVFIPPSLKQLPLWRGLLSADTYDRHIVSGTDHVLDEFVGREW